MKITIILLVSMLVSCSIVELENRGLNINDNCDVSPKLDEIKMNCEWRV